MRVRFLLFSAAAVAGWLLAAAGAQAQTPITLTRNEPLIDFWSYPHGGGAYGGRETASAFGGVGQGVDNRFAQVGLGFDTGNVPLGRPLDYYKILSAVITITITNGDTIYDPSYDPLSSYNPVDGSHTASDDAGRPIELYGAGYRNGVTPTSLKSNENTPYNPTHTSTPGTRSVYATDFVGAGGSLTGSSRDVSNNVSGLGATQPFETKPFAIGTVPANRVANGKIMADTTVTFTLNLSDPDVMRYLQASLQQGFLMFMVSSLDQAEQQVAANIPIFATKESIDGSAPATLTLQVVPEPSAVTLLLCGLALTLTCWRARRAWREPLNLP